MCSADHELQARVKGQEVSGLGRVNTSSERIQCCQSLGREGTDPMAQQEADCSQGEGKPAPLEWGPTCCMNTAPPPAVCLYISLARTAGSGTQ